ncbi:hypothetical protein [Microcella pacifica]|nr:hypothetical protein [Microcella pacifica]
MMQLIVRELSGVPHEAFTATHCNDVIVKKQCAMTERAPGR